MATITYTPARQVVVRALTRILGSRNFVIAATLLIGGGLFLWARFELNGMFARAETGEIVIRVSVASPGCASPSLYLMPSAEPGVYLAVVDVLGGGIADPSIMNIGRPAVALSFDGGDKADPLAAPRSDPVACREMAVEFSGGFAAIGPPSETEAKLGNVAPSAAFAVAPGAAGAATFTFTGATGEETAARTAFRIAGVRDVWQYGYRRLNLWNAGRTPVNVFLLAEPNTVFLSDSMEPIKAPVRNRSVAAVHLAAPGAAAGNAYQVYSRWVDYDARLQSRLITISTFFGIGISLMVEGVILVLLRLARRFRGEAAGAEDRDEGR